MTKPKLKISAQFRGEGTSISESQLKTTYSIWPIARAVNGMDEFLPACTHGSWQGCVFTCFWRYLQHRSLALSRHRTPFWPPIVTSLLRERYETERQEQKGPSAPVIAAESRIHSLAVTKCTPN